MRFSISSDKFSEKFQAKEDDWGMAKMTKEPSPCHF